MNKVLISILSFLAGICFSAVFSSGILVILCCCIFIAAIILTISGSKLKLNIPIYIVSIMFILGMMPMMVSEWSYGNIEKTFDTSSVMYGEIKDIVKNEKGLNEIRLSLKEIKNTANKHTTYKKVVVYTYTEIPENILPGDFAIVSGDLTYPTPPMNFGSFNYKYFYRSQNILGFCSNPDKISFYKGGFSLTKFFYKISSFAKTQLSVNISSPASSFVQAVILGDKSDFPEYLTENIRLSGISHVTAVSGMHVSILTMFILMITGLFTRNRRTKSKYVIATLIFYMILTGFTPSVVRAVIMSSCVLLGVIFGRRANSLLMITFTAALMLIVNPYLMYSSSFMLSFLSSYGLIIFMPSVSAKFRSSSQIAEILTMTVIANLATLPYLLWNFGSFSWIGILSNLLIVPLISFVFIGGFLTVLLGSIPFLGSFVGFLTEGITSVILATINFISSLPIGQLNLKLKNIYFLLAYILLLFVFYITLRRKIFKKLFNKLQILCYTLIVVLLFSGIYYQISLKRDFSITYLYAGQGDCAVVNIPGGKTYLVDTGNSSRTWSQCLEFLENNGIRRLSGICISHFDNDHSGAIREILKKVPTEKVYISELCVNNGSAKDFLIFAEKENTPLQKVSSGDKLKDGDVVFEFLFPDDNLTHLSDNDGSLVINISYKEKNFLFTGDITSKIEPHISRLVSDCYVLKVSHHGSDTSTSAAFLEKISPKYAVISAGINNVYGHPSDIVTQRLKYFCTRTFLTAENGAVKFTINKNGQEVIKLSRTN